jgi:hypothetical protein
MSRAFIIGDVHGAVDKLWALLVKAGVEKMRESNVEVIQLGDLGHFDENSQERDIATYFLAQQTLDILLWGNHDLACFYPAHSFVGYKQPEPLAYLLHSRLQRRWAYAINGTLLTHAGLSAYHGERFEGMTAEQIADIINEDESAVDNVRNDINTLRGGIHPAGGVVWRDAREALWMGVPQIFGHTSREEIRVYGWRGGSDDNPISLCIDVGNKHNGSLAGCWLEEDGTVSSIVAIGPDAEKYEGTL